MALKGITKDGNIVELGTPGILAQIDTEEGDEKFRDLATASVKASYSLTQEGGQANPVAPEAMRAPVDVQASGGANDLGNADKPLSGEEEKILDTTSPRRGRPPASSD